MIISEIIREAKQRARVKAKRNAKRMIIIGCTLSAFLTFAFYSVGTVQKDPLYGQMPLAFGIPMLALQTFNAVVFSSLLILILKSLGESTGSTIKNRLEQRNETKIKAQAEAIHNRFNEFGQKDFSLQIDEAKAGLKNEISESVKDIPILKEEITDLKIELAKVKDESFTREKELMFAFEQQGKSLCSEYIKNARLEKLIESLKKKQPEDEQIISGNIDVKNNSENTKSIDTDEKFE